MIAVDTSPLSGVEQGESIPFTFSVAAPKLADLPGLKNLAGSGTITQLGERLLAAGTLTTGIALECARCLKPFDYPITTPFSEEFAEAPTDDQFPLERKRLVLDPMLRAVILTHLPEQPLHDPKCKGLCPVCGKDLNKEPHRHPKKQEKPAGPFDQLNKLR